MLKLDHQSARLYIGYTKKEGDILRIKLWKVNLQMGTQ